MDCSAGGWITTTPCPDQVNVRSGGVSELDAQCLPKAAMIRSSLVALAISIGGLPALASPVDPEVHKLCIEANDYIGCVKTLSGGVKIEKDDGLNELRKVMKQGAARLRSGTSLRNSTETFRPVVDALAVVSETHPNSLNVKAATQASLLFDIYQDAWQSRIDSLTLNDVYGNIYSCTIVENGIKNFNRAIGSTALNYVKPSKTLIGINICNEKFVIANERQMRGFVIGVLQEGAIDPVTVDKYEADRAEKIRLSKMEAWERYLDQNPGTKAWAAANPAMAEKERIKYNEENPIEPISIPPYSETLEYLSQFNPPL